MDLTEKLINLVKEKKLEILFNKDVLIEGLADCFTGKTSLMSAFETCVTNRFFSHIYYKKNIKEILFLRHKAASDIIDQEVNPDDARYAVDSIVRLVEHLKNVRILSQYDEKDAGPYELLSVAVRSYDKGNYKPALAAFTSLSSSGMAAAHYYLGKSYMEDKAVAKDADKAAKCFAKGVLAGSSYATYNFGSCYLKGIGIKKDVEKGMALLKKAADMGQEDAVFAVGFMYKDSAAKNPPDLKKAIDYLQAAADYGNWSAAIAICDLYYEDAKTTGNFHKTTEARDRVANVTDAETCFKIAQIYERGLGVPVSLDKALNFSAKAAAKGYPGATEMMTRIGNVRLGS